MDLSSTLTQEQLRRICEARLKRHLTDQEFARLLQLGNGLFWDYREGRIGPYDLATLQSVKQTFERLQNT